MVWGFLIVQVADVFAPVVGAAAGLGIAVAIGAASMCWQAKIPTLAFIPGAFIGCSTFFGANLSFAETAIGLICGAFLGYVSELGATLLSRPAKS